MGLLDLFCPDPIVPKDDRTPYDRGFQETARDVLGAEPGDQMHHIKMRSQGGPNVVTNEAPLSRPEHGGAHLTGFSETLHLAREASSEDDAAALRQTAEIHLRAARLCGITVRDIDLDV